MPRLDPTFSDGDILRFIGRNLTDGEKDTVICIILSVNGGLRGVLTPTSLFTGITRLARSPLRTLLKLTFDAIVELSSTRYTLGF